MNHCNKALSEVKLQLRSDNSVNFNIWVVKWSVKILVNYRYIVKSREKKWVAGLTCLFKKLSSRYEKKWVPALFNLGLENTQNNLKHILNLQLHNEFVLELIFSSLFAHRLNKKIDPFKFL